MTPAKNLFQKSALFAATVFMVVSSAVTSFGQTAEVVGHTVSKEKNLEMYWQDDEGNTFQSIKKLRTYLENQGREVIFAMNGGMYMKDRRPLGLYVEDGVQKRKLDTRVGPSGNFHLVPNGVFYIAKNGSYHVQQTDSIKDIDSMSFATQSGPMLLINGKKHPAFNEGSKNLNIRNGVGILPDGSVHFAISEEPINFWDFASYFEKLGCRNALYLDGFVSKIYLPEAEITNQDGRFGVIIAETVNK